LAPAEVDGGGPGGAAEGAGGGAEAGAGAAAVVGGNRLADMALFPSSSRPRTLMEQLLARKIEAAAAAGGAPSAAAAPASPTASGSATPSPTSPNPPGIGGMGMGMGLQLPMPMPLTLGLGLGLGMGVVSRLRRTDSLDSTSSLGSLAFGEDVCRCDDCLLGIVDLYVISAAEAAKKKVIHHGYTISRGDFLQCTLRFPFKIHPLSNQIASNSELPNRKNMTYNFEMGTTILVKSSQY